ncbi:inorganic diphosphatase [Thermorudis peleae]|uniref:inorganic diphosphatase n=1 Tax=Thermorudis peleae TaxID=1382356 RepID=UPI00068EF2E0|nr:inorganic diphosphatase [Thermorudis peleae]
MTHGQDDCITAMIEDPAGSTVRHVLDPEHGWITYQHPYARRPWPANYGFLPGTYNPADDDPLDVIVLAASSLPTGTTTRVRPIGLFRRPDGDHKVLAVVCDDPVYGHARQLADLPPHVMTAIEEWFADWTVVLGWEDASATRALIANGQAAHSARAQQRRDSIHGHSSD